MVTVLKRAFVLKKKIKHNSTNSRLNPPKSVGVLSEARLPGWVTLWEVDELYSRLQSPCNSPIRWVTGGVLKERIKCRCQKPEKKKTDPFTVF